MILFSVYFIVAGLCLVVLVLLLSLKASGSLRFIMHLLYVCFFSIILVGYTDYFVHSGWMFEFSLSCYIGSGLSFLPGRAQGDMDAFSLCCESFRVGCE